MAEAMMLSSPMAVSQDLSVRLRNGGELASRGKGGLLPLQQKFQIRGRDFSCCSRVFSDSSMSIRTVSGVWSGNFTKYEGRRIREDSAMVENRCRILGRSRAYQNDNNLGAVSMRKYKISSMTLRSQAFLQGEGMSKFKSGISRSLSCNKSGRKAVVICQVARAAVPGDASNVINDYIPNFTGGEMITEKLWRDFFSDPSQWWDHRAEKENQKYPDFRHKKTSAGLWVISRLNPPWVEAELAAMASTNLQEHAFSWNKRLARYVKAGQYEKALEHFDQMQRLGIFPDRFTFIAVIKACAKLHALKEGRSIHSQIRERGYGSDLYISSGLVDMYARCGSIEDAQGVFDTMSTRDVVSWNAIIFGHVKCGNGQTALELSEKMQVEGVEPDTVTYVGMLNACTCLKALEEGRHVHEQIIQRGLDSGVFIGSSLIDMYATCGSINDARRIFDKVPKRDVVCWNAMIQGYLKCAQGQKALDLFLQMQQEGSEPNTATFVGLLSACASVGALAEGRFFHEKALQRGLESEGIVGTTLIHMYSECGSIREAWRVFNRMDTRNVMGWNAMIESFVKCGQDQLALELYWTMHREKLEPSRNTYVAALKACATLSARREGRRVHESLVRRGLESVPSVGAALIHMYAGCRKIKDAWTVFIEMPMRDVGCWNVMLQGFVNCGQGQKALELYRRMQPEGVQPNVGTFVEALSACGMVGALEEGKDVHAHICAQGLESDASLRRAFSKMYALCERKNKLQTVFGKLPRHDEVSLLTTLIDMSSEPAQVSTTF